VSLFGSSPPGLPAGGEEPIQTTPGLPAGGEVTVPVGSLPRGELKSKRVVDI